MITSNLPADPHSLETKGAGAVDLRRWLIVGLLSLGAIIAYVSRTNISAALAYKPFIEHFQLSDIDRGALNSAFFWSYAALQIPVGWRSAFICWARRSDPRSAPRWPSG